MVIRGWEDTKAADQQRCWEGVGAEVSVCVCVCVWYVCVGGGGGGGGMRGVAPAQWAPAYM